MRPIVAHVSTAHPADDPRIVYRECSALAEAGYDVHFVGLGCDELSGPPLVTVHSAGPRSRSRLFRMTFGTLRVLSAAVKLRAKVVHVHDPEVMLFAVLLRLAGTVVIWDVHENAEIQILAKQWLAPLVRRPVSILYLFFEWAASRLASGNVVVYERVSRRMPSKKTVLVRNYPRLDEFPATASHLAREGNAVYVGALTKIRGARYMVEVAQRLSHGKVVLAGRFAPDSLEVELEALPGWTNVENRGQLGRKAVRELLEGSSVGLSLLHPVETYHEAEATKVYEYMACGLPVAVTPLRRTIEIVEKHGCGVVVPADDAISAAKAIDALLEDPALRSQLGARGRRAVEDHYNWENERRTLLELYSRLAPASEFAR